MRRLIVSILLATVMIILPDSPAGGRQARQVPNIGNATFPSDHNYSAAQVVQFNIYGGNGNATSGYNTQVAPAIVASIEARNPYPFMVGLNEVCQNQYNYLVWVLTADGYGYSASNT